LDDPRVLIKREIEIARPVEEVFQYVADPANDVHWCPKVKSVEPAGDGRWSVIHKPIPLRPARRLDLRRVSAAPPVWIELLEDDGTDVFRVTYELEVVEGGTRLRQSSDADLGAPRLVQPIVRAGVARDIERQLRELKRVLES
jgi:hypothetical protein